jgi:glycerol-3-phosphate acyltransferase PlsX
MSTICADQGKAMIAVDAMGGDLAPHAIVQGALYAARSGIPITLFGDEKVVIPILDTLDAQWRKTPIALVHCTEKIDMHDVPTRSVIRKKDASLVRAIQFVADGSADAIVSAGNSGAVMVSSTLLIGRACGISRPGIGGFLPTSIGNNVFCLDLGANIDCKPEHLEQFALMGHVYVQLVKNIENPRVGLLANGHEPYKGSALVKEVYKRLSGQKVINFIGNVEARDVFEGHADVVVTDGFVGNVLLKAAQGTSRMIMNLLRTEVGKLSWWRRLLYAINKQVIYQIRKDTDYAQAGGALLLGLKKPVIVAHGCSHGRAIEQAIRFAHRVAEKKFISVFNARIHECLKQGQRPGFVSQKVRSVLEWVHQS